MELDNLPTHSEHSTYVSYFLHFIVVMHNDGRERTQQQQQMPKNIKILHGKQNIFLNTCEHTMLCMCKRKY